MINHTLLLCLLLLAVRSEECNSTLAHYLSPHSLGKQDEFADAMNVICKQVRPKTTMYQFGKTNYTLYNISVKCIYNDGKQVADIPRNNTITITGGKVEFAVNFNFSVSRIGPDKTGWAYASVISDVVNFSKTIVRDGAQTLWTLTGDLPQISLTNALEIKRIDPKQTDDDMIALGQALSSAIQLINPANVRQQIVSLANENLTAVLNNTLKEEVFNNVTQYTFQHPFKGDLKVNFTNYFHLFRIGQQEGFELMYLTFLENGSTKFCQWDIPVQHQDYSIFGGIQSAYGLDLVAEVGRYALRKGWLDTSFNNTSWESNAFQFYAGDLYDIINSTQKLAARTRIVGSCTAQDDGTFNVTRRSDSVLKVDVKYQCQLQTNDTARITLSNFSVLNTFLIKLVPQYETLEFVIQSATGTATFQPVGEYTVIDEQLANFKLGVTLRSLQDYRVFGSGFPTWPRDVPEVMIHSSGRYFLLYDGSQIPHAASV